MRHMKNGVICLAEKKVFTPEGEKILVYWAVGRNLDDMTNAQEVFFEVEVPESFRKTIVYDDAEQFLKLRDFENECRRQ